MRSSFQKLFKTNGARDMSHVPDEVPKLVTDEMNSVLISAVSDEEVTEVVFQLRACKALVPDGFSGIFYQRFWSIIKEDVVGAVMNFFENGKCLRR